MILSILLVSCGSYLEESEIDIIATIANNAYNRYKTEINSTKIVETSTIQPTQLIPTNTVTPSKTNTLMPTPTNTVVSTNTKTTTATKTNTPTRTPTKTFTSTFTVTFTPTLTSTPVSTKTFTLLPSSTQTSTPTPLSVVSNVYYVSNSGNDSNNGNITNPWKTLVYASGKLKAGDTLYIRGGTYKEVTSWSTDGTQLKPITIMNYPGESVVIDGYDTIPANTGGTWMFMVWGDWYYVGGLEVTRSFDEGAIGVKGEYVIIDNCYTHHNWGAGITVMGSYSTAQYNRVWYNGVSNENGTNTRGGWPASLTCARYPDHCTLKGNTSWENWGEGISTFEANHTIIEDNISYDNMQNFYMSDTQYSIMQRNFSYCSVNNIVDPYSTQNGILIGDEKASSSNNTIINNIVYGCDRNLASGTNESTNNIIANNTFVNTDSDYNILFYSGTCTNCKFVNNIILQEDSHIIAVNAGTGWSFFNNLWSKTPSSKLIGTNDIIGNPLLLENTSYDLTSWYILNSSSPAIGKAMVLDMVLNDYFNYTRDNLPDIGAIEYH
jgi:uncharacterized protein YuzB (UPF0349 family)